MTATKLGSHNGSIIDTYEIGKEYDMSMTAGYLELARAFIAENWAEEVVKHVPPKPKTKRK